VRTLIIVIIFAVAGYYVYQGMFAGRGDTPSCEQIFQSCSTKCRKTETETEPYNACQKKCQGALDECKR
jgi:hypothetical protein